MQKKHIYENILIDKSKEEFLDLLNHDNIRIERIVSNGQKSEEDFWYEQEENEFVLLLDGDAVLEIQNEDGSIKEIELNKNEYINIKAYVKHRVKYTNTSKPTVWLAIFY